MNTIEDNLNQRISARIRIERESRGWSLNDLAERAGASRAMIHKIERGESSPTASMLGRLSGAFGISMSTLIARAEMQEGKLLRFASQPVSGIEMAFATPKEVITHVPWLSDEPRFPAIVGIATLAMVESSTCMNVASDSAIVIMTSCAPSSGFCCCITLTPNYPALA